MLRGLELWWCKKDWNFGVKRIGSIILIRDAATTMLTNPQHCIFKPDCFIVRLMYDEFVHFPSGADAVSTSWFGSYVCTKPWGDVGTCVSGWFGRLRPLTRGGGPPSLTFESRRISRCASLTPRPPCRADVSLDSSAKPLARLSRSAWKCVH